MGPDEFGIDRRSMLVANSIAFAIWGGIIERERRDRHLH